MGGFLSHLLNKRSERAGGAHGKGIRERGVIIASGLMAGGALGGVFGAALRLIPGYRKPDQDPILFVRSRLSIRFRAAFCWPLSVSLVRFFEEGKGEILMDQVGRFVANAVLAIDTLWGGDVLRPSGTGRFIADSWFSDEPMPSAYTHPAAARLRQSGGVSGKSVDRDAVEQYLRQVDLPQAIAGIRQEAGSIGGLRQSYLTGMAVSLETMWDLAMELLGKGDPAPYARSVEAATAKLPSPQGRRKSVSALLNCWAAPDTPCRVRTGYWEAVDAGAGTCGPDGIGTRTGRRRDRPFL